MKLHANHRTCPSSRKLICQRVLEEGWTIVRAAEAAGCSERTAAKWLRRYRDGDLTLHDRSSQPRRSPKRLPAERVRAIEALRRLRMTAAEIAEILLVPLSTVSLWLERLGLGKRSPPGSTRAAQPLRAPSSRRARARRHQAPRPHPRSGPPHHGRSGIASKDAPRGSSARGCGFRVRARDDRRPLSPRIRGGARRPHRKLCGRLPAPCGRLVCAARRAGARGDERQRLLLPRFPVRQRPRRARPAPPAHQAGSSTHQRQGLCIRIVVPSGWTARLLTPVGLTQAKGMSRTRVDRRFR